MTQRLNPGAVALDAMKALAGVRAHIAQSGLPAALVDLVYLRVSQINGCAYCIDSHSRDLLKHGMTIDKLMLVPAWREADALFDARERAALIWAESLTRIGQTQDVPDADFEAARAVFDESEIAELTVAVGLMNAYNRVGVGLRLTPAAVAKAAAA
jgi:AhpD family alkylhydroperoxidase